MMYRLESWRHISWKALGRSGGSCRGSWAYVFSI